jgi:hypothetical protein
MSPPKITAELYDFEWPVDSHGYVIVPRSSITLISNTQPHRPPYPASAEDLERHGQRAYWHREICARGGAIRLYRPMTEEPGLWREFAETCIAEEAVLKFITKYGLLSNDICLVDDVIRGAKIIREVMDLFDTGRHADAIGAFNAHAQASARVQISNKELRPYPEELYGALLIQMGQAITGDHKFKRCQNPECTSWIRIGVGASTKRRKFCSDRCRVAVSRLKAEQA